MKQLPVYCLSERADESIVLEAPIYYFRDHFVGVSMAENWSPPLLTVRNKSKKLKDFVRFNSTAPAISERAVAALRPILEPYCEFLPLIGFGSTVYYAVNVLNAVDCLDWQRSEVLFATDDPGYLLMIDTFAFVAERVPNAPIFKPLPNFDVFVKKPFIDCVIQNGLTNAILRDPAVDPLPLIHQGIDTNVVPELPK